MHLKVGMRAGPNMEPTEGEIRILKTWPSGTRNGENVYT